MSTSSKKLFGVIVCDKQAKWGGPTGIAQRIKDLLAKDGQEWNTFIAEEGELPTEQDLQTFEGFYITGSKHSVNDESKPWIQHLVSFILQASKHPKKPKVFGTCFGHQAIGKALGGEVTNNPSKKFVCHNEEIELLESKRYSSFLEDVKKISETNWLRMLESHGECVSKLPENAESVARSASCENEIVLYSENIIGIQSHPDFGVEDLTNIIIPSLIEKNIDTTLELCDVSKSLELSNDCGDVAKAVSDFLS